MTVRIRKVWPERERERERERDLLGVIREQDKLMIPVKKTEDKGSASGE